MRNSEPAPAGAAEDPGIARSSGLRLRGFVPVEFVRHDAAGGVGYAETAAQAGQSGVAVTSVAVRGEPHPDPDGAWPDPIAARAEPGTLFLDTDL